MTTNIPFDAMHAERRHITTTRDSTIPFEPTVNGQKLQPVIGMMTSSSDQTNANKQKHFPFLELPAELRVLVYEHLLVASEPWRLAALEENRSTLYPNILATCKLVRQEATPVLYGCNEFEFNSLLRRGSAAQFLNRISDSAYHISAITINLLLPTRKELKSLRVLLKNCAALTKLTIGYYVWKSYEPHAFAKAVGPLARLLHKNQQKKQDFKTRDVLDGLHFAAPQLCKGHPNLDALQVRLNERAAGFEEKVKDLLRPTSK
ncbi:unnamed protein product [Cercospora beticola]|nr:unnamed protein product [Cercospora beticola]